MTYIDIVTTKTNTEYSWIICLYTLYINDHMIISL